VLGEAGITWDGIAGRPDVEITADGTTETISSGDISINNTHDEQGIPIATEITVGDDRLKIDLLTGDIEAQSGSGPIRTDNLDSSSLDGDILTILSSMSAALDGNLSNVQPGLTTEDLAPVVMNAGDAGAVGFPVSPGYPTDPLWVVGGVPIVINAIVDLIGVAETRSSPLVFDLGDSGTIDLISLANSSAWWDLDQDGFSEHTGWVSADDGVLGRDINGNGLLDDNSELFGTMDTDGFSILAEHDSNSDGVISAEDAIWDDLVIWQDVNENGVSDYFEVSYLSEYDIISISLEATEVSQTNQGNAITHTSTFVVDDGVSGPDTRIVHDVWFTMNETNTYYSGEYVTDFRTFYMPELRGYGTLPSLRIAMSMDNEGAGNLLDLVKNLTFKDFDDLFTEDETIVDDVRDILFRWAEVDGLTGNERGAFVDSRELGFLEKLSGTPFSQRGIYNNPQGVEAGEDIKQAFSMALNAFYGRLLIQISGSDLFIFESGYDLGYGKDPLELFVRPAYDHVADEFPGIAGIDSSKLDELETEATGLANTGEREIFWSNVLRMIEFTIGVDNLSGGDQTALSDAIEASDVSLDMATLIADLDYVRAYGIIEAGTSGNDTINGSSGDDQLSGGIGADTISSVAGDDFIDGDSGDDILTGGLGGDFIRGSVGNDEYHYAAGDGHDTYREQSTGSGNDDDRIIFGAGIDINDLTLTRVGNTDIVIEIDNGTATGRIVLEDHFNYAAGGGHIELLEFSDTSTFDLDGQSWTTYGTAGNDLLRGVRDGSGGLGNDTIYGYAGNDTIYVNAPNESDSLANTVYGGDDNDRIYGHNGADTLYGENGDDYIEGGGGADTLSGGAGDDRLIGETGNDTYIYSGGHDYINDTSGTEVINLDAVWNGVTPQYLRTGNTLMVWFNANNTITINNHYSGNAVESMVYANSTTVNLTTVSAVSQGTSGNDTLTGTSGADTTYGYDGNDTITGANGNDVLYGGNGNDSLSGGNNNDYLDGGPGDDSMEGGGHDDTYYYASGHDYIDDSSGTDTLIFANGWTIGQMTFDRYIADDNDLVIGINAANSVTIEGQLGNTRDMETYTFQAGNVTPNTIVVTFHGSSGNDTMTGIVYGGSQNDIMYGYDGNDTMNGGDGADTLYGGNDNDTMSGGQGNDIIYGGAGNDYMEGNPGADTFVYESGLDQVNDYNTNSANDTLWISGGRTISDLSFSNVSTSHTKITLTASTHEIQVDYLRGGSQHHVEWVKFDDGFLTSLPDYASWLNGTSGNDTVAGNGSDNTLVGFAGNDTMTGGSGNDDMHGGAGNDTLDGDNGTNLLYGGDGDDILYGEGGLDTLHGGDGEDTFIFLTASAFSNVDVIRDFSVADDDVLDLTDILDTVYDPLTDDIADFISFSESSGSTFVSVDRDGTGGTYSMAQIIKLENVTGVGSAALLETNGNLLAA